MYSKIVILNFPPVKAQQPLVCQLTKKFNLLFNILNAKISHKKEGYMVIDLVSESKAAFNKGIKYLKDQNVSISYPEHQIYKNEEICNHCGACIAVCPTEALYIKRPEMEILFNKDKCSICELCIPTCPAKAMGLFASEAKHVA